MKHAEPQVLRKSPYLPQSTQTVLYVLEFKHDHPQLVRFLSFVVCFPVSEAVVESWGSSLEYIYKKKHNVQDGIGLAEVGTVDKLAFIRLNGPPPAMLIVVQ